jgi:pyrophosphatase PpaX
MKPLTTILFDVDGTLLDTKEFILRSFEHTFAAHNLTHLSREDAYTVMGKPLEECYQTIAPALDFVLLCKTHRMFQENNLSLVKPFKNTLATLMRLKEQGIKLAAVSTRKQTGLNSLELSGISPFLDTVITGDYVTHFKPPPEGLFMALERLESAPGEALMVGDTEADILAGKQANTGTAAATYGFASKELLHKHEPDYMLNDIADVVRLLEK